MFSAAAMQAVIYEDVKIDVVHTDTTSWSLTGVYEDSSPDGDAMHITYGYIRDHRPDLKQFNYGLVVSGDGIPIIGEAMDGNTQEKVWNRRVLEELVAPEYGVRYPGFLLHDLPVEFKAAALEHHYVVVWVRVGRHAHIPGTYRPGRR
ncbi:MAG TPA: hypothetical protein GX506_12530 [Firmicutes bacterium]|nr:hypothetical protein [Bacillota bacterium]